MRIKQPFSFQKGALEHSLGPDTDQGMKRKRIGLLPDGNGRVLKAVQYVKVEIIV